MTTEIFYLKVIAGLIGGFGSLMTPVAVWTVITTVRNQSEISTIKKICEERHKKSLQLPSEAL